MKLLLTSISKKNLLDVNILLIETKRDESAKRITKCGQSTKKIKF